MFFLIDEIFLKVLHSFMDWLIVKWLGMMTPVMLSSPLFFSYLLKSQIIYFLFPFILQTALQDYLFLAYTKYLNWHNLRTI